MIVICAKSKGRELAERVYPLLVLNDIDLLTFLDARVAIRGQLCGYYGIDIVVFMATTSTSRFCALEFLQSRHQKLEEYRLDCNKCPGAYLYLHQYQRPLMPVAHGHYH